VVDKPAFVFTHRGHRIWETNKEINMSRVKFLFVALALISQFAFVSTAPPQPGPTILTIPDIKVIQYIDNGLKVNKCFQDIRAKDENVTDEQIKVACLFLVPSANSTPPNRFYSLFDWMDFKDSQEYRGYQHIFQGSVICENGRVRDYVIPHYEFSYGYTKLPGGIYHPADVYQTTISGSPANFNGHTVSLTNSGQSLQITDARAARLSDAERAVQARLLYYDAPFIFTKVIVEISCLYNTVNVTVDRSIFPATRLYVDDKLTRKEPQKRLGDFIVSGGEGFPGGGCTDLPVFHCVPDINPVGQGNLAPAGKSMNWAASLKSNGGHFNTNLPGPWAGIDGHWTIQPDGMHGSLFENADNGYLVFPTSPGGDCAAYTADITLLSGPAAGLAFNILVPDQPSLSNYQVNISNRDQAINLVKIDLGADGIVHQTILESYPTAIQNNLLYILQLKTSPDELEIFLDGNSVATTPLDLILFGESHLGLVLDNRTDVSEAVFQNVTLQPTTCPGTEPGLTFTYVSSGAYGVGTDCANPGSNPSSDDWLFRVTGVPSGYVPVYMDDGVDGFWVAPPCDAQFHWPLIATRASTPAPDGTFGWNIYVAAWRAVGQEPPPGTTYTLRLDDGGGNTLITTLTTPP